LVVVWFARVSGASRRGRAAGGHGDAIVADYSNICSTIGYPTLCHTHVAVKRRFVLASASPARLLLLRGAGLDPEVRVSHVPEDEVDGLDPPAAVNELARRKAREVAARLRSEAADRDQPDGNLPLVVGCDSLLEFAGQVWGKPSGPDEVSARWRQMRGRRGLLHTGHCLIDASDSREATACDTAVVHFGRPDDREIEAYARTDEALAVAGPFTLEGRSAPWVERIDGNYGTITGISLPVLRRLLLELGVSIVDLWR
jgi:septum formation protein